MAKCVFTGKQPRSGNNVPKSQHKTERLIQPNVQKVHGIKMSTRFYRTLKKHGITQPGQPIDTEKLITFLAK